MCFTIASQAKFLQILTSKIYIWNIRCTSLSTVAANTIFGNGWIRRQLAKRRMFDFIQIQIDRLTKSRLRCVIAKNACCVSVYTNYRYRLRVCQGKGQRFAVASRRLSMFNINEIGRFSIGPPISSWLRRATSKCAVFQVHIVAVISVNGRSACLIRKLLLFFARQLSAWYTKKKSCSK